MLRKLFPHSIIVISLMYVVFYFIDRVNPAMAFINNSITKVLLLVLCIAAILNAILTIRYNRMQERRRQQRLRQQQLQRQRQARG